MNKIFYLITLIMCFILLGCIKSRGTIEEITGVEFNKIDYIKIGNASNQSEDYDVEKFISEYKNLKYKKASGEYGNAAHLYYVCYDVNNEVLFTLIEVGSQNRVFIKKGIFDINKDSSSNLYQLE